VTDSLTSLKEALELGLFSEAYNRTKLPKLTYASRHPSRSGRADFTVWDESLRWSRDLELTSIWKRGDDSLEVPDEAAYLN
jgi:hypothetical protein